METNLHVVNNEEGQRKVEVDWADTEWFQVWLRLARRDYHGHPEVRELRDHDDATIAA